MTNNQDWYDEIDDEVEGEFEDFSEPVTRRGKGDDVVTKLRRAERSQQKKIKELESELTTIRKSQRDSTIKSVLESKGINPKVAAFVPQDVDMSADSITQWLDDYAEVFGMAASTKQQEVNQNDLAVLRQIDAVTAGSNSMGGVDDMYTRLDNAGSAEEIMDMIYGTE